MKSVFRFALLFVSMAGLICVGQLFNLQLRTSKHIDFTDNVNKLTVIIAVNNECPLSKQYAPELKNIVKTFSGLPVAFVFLIVNNDSADAMFKIPGSTCKTDPLGEIANQLHIRIVPSAIVYAAKSGVEFEYANVKYQGAIDDWAIELGKHRLTTEKYYLKNAIKQVLEGANPNPKTTLAVGCFTELLQK